MTTTPTHGRRATYLRGCRCEPCSRANAEYCKRYKLRVLTDPTSTGVPAGPIAKHIAHLRRLGMTTGAIAAAAGVPSAVVRRIPDQRRVRRDTAAAIRRVRITDDVGRCQVGATGTTRRVQALRSLGYSTARIAAAIPYPYRMLMRIEDGTRPRVESRTAARVRELYDAWSMHPPVATERHERSAITRARRSAERRGYAPPLAWDDDTIDDPETRPAHRVTGDSIDHAAITRVLAGDPVTLSRPERLVALEQLVPLGLSDNQIARRLGVSDRTVERDRRELGIPSQWRAA